MLSHVGLFVTHGLQPGSSVHGLLQASILEWVAISSSRGSSLTQDSSQSLLHLLPWQADSLPLSHLGNTFRRWWASNRVMEHFKSENSVIRNTPALCRRREADLMDMEETWRRAAKDGCEWKSETSSVSRLKFYPWMRWERIEEGSYGLN